MCTLTMPVDFGMIVAASPPIYSHSPTGYTTGYLANYSCRYTPLEFNREYNSYKNNFKEGDIMPMTLLPKRPCLTIRTESLALTNDECITSPTRLKKKVVFADDKGLRLTEVKVMTEPSDCPPRWTAEFLAQIVKGASAEVALDSWELTFPQPASEYLEFRNKLNTKYVNLENVILKEADQVVTGTIKVKNITFHKEVCVRASFDDWKSHEDILASYVPDGVQSTASYNIYDTFSFRISIPPKPDVQKLEFCVFYTCAGQEYWDNNDGKNYVITKKVCAKKDVSQPIKAKNNHHPTEKFTDALMAKLDSWSEFASWNHLVNETPYW